MQNNLQKNLFATSNLSDYLDARLNSVFDVVEQMPQAEFQQSTPEVFTRKIIAQFSIEPLVLNTAQEQTVFSPTQINVPAQRDYVRHITPPTVVAGHLMSVVIPFTGHAPLWTAHPQGVGSGLQPQGVVDTERGTLTLQFIHTGVAGDTWYERRKSEMLSRIDIFFNYQAETLTEYSANLARVAQRAAELKSESILP